MKLTYLLPITSLVLGYYLAEARDFAPPTLPQGERYVSAQLFGVPDVPAHAVIASMPLRASLLGSKVIPSITVTKSRPNRRVAYDYGWDPEREFAKLDAVLVTTEKRGYLEGCPIPKPVWEAINALDESAHVKSIVAGAGWVESRWKADTRVWDTGGYSHGVWQLHGHWRKVDVAWMEKQPGGWRCPKNNLAAFLRTIKAHERYYPGTKGSWKLKLAHYNGGSKPNLVYANKCLTKSKELVRWFK